MHKEISARHAAYFSSLSGAYHEFTIAARDLNAACGSAVAAEYDARIAQINKLISMIS